MMVSMLAGCSAEGDPEADALAEAERAARELDVEATDTTGVIRGVVVDQSITPLAGAFVDLANTGMNTTTTEAGVFAFEGLEAGTYFLTATLLDYTTVQQSVEVVAGVDDPDAVRVMLQAVPRGIPSITSLTAVIFLSGSGWVDGVGGVTVSSLTGEGNFFFEVEIPPNGTVAQTELVWDPTTPLGAEGRPGGGTYSGNDDIDTDSFAGTSPLIMRANATDEGGDTADNVRYDFYAWPSSGLPAGFQFNQKIDAYVNVFYNFRPNDGWTFVADGPHPLPE